MIKYALIHFDLNLRNRRGQCYDVAVNMAGHLHGVRAKIAAEQPKAIFIHCADHSLNLALQEAVRAVPLARDTIEYTKDISAFIRMSAKRESVFEQVQKDLAAENSEDSVRFGKLKTLCPTRWAVGVKSVAALLHHYKALRNTLETIASSDKSESGTKTNGFCEVMTTFQFLFGLMSSKNTFEPVETLSCILQNPNLCAAEARSSVKKTTEVLSALRSDEQFSTLWQDCMNKTRQLEVNESQLPWQRCFPRKMDSSSDTAYSFRLFLRLFLIISASSASAERSFSCLRRLKTYLRATTTAQRLNSVAVLHTHKDRCTNLDLREIGNIFASKNEEQRDLFGKF
ncbi:UNVERIFIED_CONTAM: hypothetical protein FKN15_011472 [Acipenser sinensis]